MKFNARLILAGALVWCSFLALLCGCQKNTAQAVPRNSKSKPVFGNVGTLDVEKKSGDIDFGFLHPDHFACLGFDIQRIISRSDFDDVPWDNFEDQLAGLVGNANADLGSIERVWLLLDRETVSSAMSGKPDGANGSWFTAVIKYHDSPNLKQLALVGLQESSAKESSESDSDEASSEDEVDAKKEVAEANAGLGPQLAAESIGEKLIAIGSRAMVEKLKKDPASVQCELANRLSRVDFSADVEGVIATGPVRETLSTLFGMAARFGGQEAKKLKTLPDVLEQIDVRVSLEQSDSNLMSIRVEIDDKKMIEAVVRASQQAIEKWSDPKAKGVFGRAVQSGGSSEELASQKIAQQVSREIQEKKLLSVESDDDSVLIQLRRPTNISKLVRALVSDLGRKADLVNEKKTEK